MAMTRPLPNLRRRKRKYRRAVEANVGIRNRYAREITNLINNSNELLIDFVKCELELSEYVGETEVTIAQDANPLSFLKGLAKKVTKKVGELAATMQARIRSLANWFTGSMTASTTASQVDACKKGGLSEEYIRSLWTGNTINGQYISPEAAALVPTIIQAQTSLITKLTSDDLQRIQTAIAESLDKGIPLPDLERVLESIKGFNPRRAQLVAMDQANKINISVLRANDISLGLTQAVWIHVPGQYTSRESHIMLDGQGFDLRTGIFDPEVQRNIQCAELPYCRCVYRVGLPEFLPDRVNAGRTGQLDLLTEAQKRKDLTVPKSRSRGKATARSKDTSAQYSLFEATPPREK